MITRARIAVLAVAKATAHLGDREAPGNNNTGEQVDRFLAFVGLGPGYSWCMAFVCFCFGMSAQQAGATLDDTGLVKTASCNAQADHARRMGILVDAADAKTRLVPGWVMLKWERGAYHHTGIVTDYDEASGVFKTIEGNTNLDGGSEGYEVARQSRGINDTVDGHPKYAFIQTT